ncbi:hypothetical protein MPER_06158, partial [Moniliophthora perniciosa FA553]
MTLCNDKRIYTKSCGAICPDGKCSLTTGKGNRFVLANTEVLHDKITELATRVRTLEDALAQSHSINSLHPHPLLSEELLQIKRPLERERLDHPATKEEKQENSDTIDAMGSLQFLDVPWLAYAFPFTSSANKSAEGLRGSILSLLPKLSAARNLCNIYYRHAAWMYTPITEDQFYEVVFRPVYEVRV